MDTNITKGTLLCYTKEQPVYQVHRDYDELGNLIRSTSRMNGTVEVNTLYEVVSVRVVKDGLSLSVLDEQGNRCRIRLTAANRKHWSICEPIPSYLANQ